MFGGLDIGERARHCQGCTNLNWCGTCGVYILEMCSVSTNGERACPAQGFQLIGYHFSYHN